MQGPDTRLACHALLAKVVAITREASDRAMARWQGEFAHWDKSPGQVVTELDLELDALLRDRLGELDPQAAWLSEETADTSARLKARRLWVVDPIDGTRDYVRGRPGWAVSVALVEDGKVVLGVLDAPARGETWAAARGNGATRNGVSLQVKPRDTLDGARVPMDALPAGSRLVVVPKPNSIALRIAMIASGDADLVATDRWGHEWDVAAAALIATEAGATVTDARGTPLRFNSPSGQMFGVLVSAPGIHATALAMLARRSMGAAGG